MRTGKTFAEKALARAAKLETVSAGQVIDIEPDLIFSHDNSAYIKTIFESIGAQQIRYPERVAITLDHAVPAPTTRHAQNHAEIRKWVKDQGIQHFFEVGRGICHQVISEEALILPGQVILGSDSHSTHFGWLGAFGMGVGRTEMAALWASGGIWIQVPQAIQIELIGKLHLGVTAKDIALFILRTIGAEGGHYRSLELTGEGLEQLSIDERPVIPNMMAEAGVMNAYMPPNSMVLDYLKQRTNEGLHPVFPDEDAHYEARYTIDLNQLSPQIAHPHSPDQVTDMEEAIGIKIEQAFIGTCTNGRFEDLEAAAKILKGKKISKRLIVIPASSEVLLKAIESGVLEILVNAGASIGTPGCGPCMGNHMGVPAPQETTISTSSRNFKGRMGTSEAPIYLANAYVVAAAAIKGEICHPEDLL